MADLCLDCVLALRASVIAAFVQVGMSGMVTEDQVSKEMGVSLTFWLVALCWRPFCLNHVFLLQL